MKSVAATSRSGSTLPRGVSRGLASLLLCLAATAAGHSQRSGPPQMQNPFPATSTTQNGLPPARDPMDAANQEKLSKLRNDERQRRLIADTDKLLQLATALHEDVSKTNKDVLSLDVIRRAEEIERLAHGVKERMKS